MIGKKWGRETNSKENLFDAEPVGAEIVGPDNATERMADAKEITAAAAKKVLDTLNQVQDRKKFFVEPSKNGLAKSKTLLLALMLAANLGIGREVSKSTEIETPAVASINTPKTETHTINLESLLDEVVGQEWSPDYKPGKFNEEKTQKLIEEINKIVDEARASGDTNINVKFSAEGGATPEGNPAKNKVLAEGRAKKGLNTVVEQAAKDLHADSVDVGEAKAMKSVKFTDKDGHDREGSLSDFDDYYRELSGAQNKDQWKKWIGMFNRNKTKGIPPKALDALKEWSKQRKVVIKVQIESQHNVVVPENGESVPGFSHKHTGQNEKIKKLSQLDADVLKPIPDQIRIQTSGELKKVRKKKKDGTIIVDPPPVNPSRMRAERRKAVKDLYKPGNIGTAPPTKALSSSGSFRGPAGVTRR